MKFLSEGQIVDVVAPGYPCLPEEVMGAKEFLKSWGLKPNIPKNIIGKHFIHSADDEIRIEHLVSAIQNPDSDIIWCLRGGYGSNRLLPALSKLKKPSRKKFLVGISDITSLHNFVIQEWGWQTLHAPLLDRLGKGLVPRKIEKELHDLLWGAAESIQFKKLKPLNKAARAVKSLESSVVGGNLTVLQSSLGTPWQIDLRKKLLFVEDIGERGYRIDRMFEQFRQAGLFEKCDGLLLGDFLGGDEPKTGKNNFKMVFKRWADDLDIPVFSGIEAGHGVVQRPLPLGTKAVIRANADSKFILDVKNVRIK